MTVRIPPRATHASFTYSPDVHVSWPSWGGGKGWDVWNSRRHTQGATCVRHGVPFDIAEGVALEIVARLAAEDAKEERKR
jgi:hypothetical protein